MSNEMKVGIAGLGAIGRTHLERINKRLRGARVTAVTDGSESFGREISGRYDLPFYASAEEMISLGGIDALLITAADADHERYVMAGIKAGIPVFCEKPLAPDAEACLRIVEAELHTGKRLVQVGFMRRYDAGYRELKRLIDSREYGRPLLIHCAQRNSAVGESFTTEMAVTSALIHEIDILRWLIGEDYETAQVVTPKSTVNTHEGYRDPQMLLLTSKSGVWMDTECFLNCRVGYDIQCEVVCEQGILRLPDLPAVERLVAEKRIKPICGAWSDRFVDAYNVEIQNWIDNAVKGEVQGPSAWDGYAACVASDAAHQSREAGHPVSVTLDAQPEFYNALSC